MTDEPKKELSEAEKRRLVRFERARTNRRGCSAVMPDKLARTSAFTPRKKGHRTKRPGEAGTRRRVA